MTKTFIEKVKIKNPIGNLYRKNHVLVLIEKEDSTFILGKKKGFYPDHISRMIGGGIDENEDPQLAAKREVQEELSLDLPIENFNKLCEVITKAESNDGYMEMTTHIYHVLIKNKYIDKINVGDDLSHTHIYNKEEYFNLIDEMNKLETEFVTDEFSFSWKDWGKIYAPIHKYATEEL